MSINPETDLDLEKLFQPAWARESSEANRYAKYEPKERFDRRDPRDRDRPRRDVGGDRRSPGFEKGRKPRAGGKGRRPADRTHRRETPPPLPEITVAVQAEERGADSLARQIKTTGRAYPLFDIAAMILQKPDRYVAIFGTKPGPDGKALQPLFVCALDESLWLSEAEAVAHVLRDHLATFYQADRTAIEPPKGTYTFVAQCGMSGVILGPPNHHDYQAKLRELHARQFSRLPFEVFKSRVKIVRDEAVVKQWLEEQSWKTEYLCLNVPEAIRLPDLASVEEHFRQVHLPTIIRPVDSHTLPGPACHNLRGGLWRAYRAVFEQQRRFPMQVATSLSQQFASRGLQFFKVNKTITHVWVARPTFLDLDTEPVSDTIRRIVQFINEHPKCTRRQLIETLAPSPTPSPAPGGPQAESAPREEPSPKQEAQTAEGSGPTPHAPSGVESSEPTPEQTAIIGDLHWLIHQGHVIEFANGLLETAKKPAPKPPAPPKKQKPKHEPASKTVAGAPPPEPSTPTQPRDPAAPPPPADPEGTQADADHSQVADQPGDAPREPRGAAAAPAEPSPAADDATPARQDSESAESSQADSGPSATQR